MPIFFSCGHLVPPTTTNWCQKKRPKMPVKFDNIWTLCWHFANMSMTWCTTKLFKNSSLIIVQYFTAVLSGQVSEGCCHPQNKCKLGLNKKSGIDDVQILCFPSLYFFMACFEGILDRHEWWSSLPVNAFEGAPFWLGNISLWRFEDIMQGLRYTNCPRPDYEDRFHDVRELIDTFNNHCENNYHPGWLSCLDESMIYWLSKYCPGWMCIPWKPHLFGNKYHTICDGDSKKGCPLIYQVELVEGKDWPKELGPKEFEDQGKTVGLMMHMSKNLWNIGKIVTMDSGFLVAKGILAMREKGVFGQSLVKPRGCGWLVLVPRKYIDEYFANKEIGYCKTLEQIVDGVKLIIHCQKEHKYVTKIMACHGVLIDVDDHATCQEVVSEDGTRRTINFKYPKPISRKNQAKHWVNNTNNLWLDSISLAAVWRTIWWPNKQYTFSLEVAEVNAANAKARGQKKIANPQLRFHRKLENLMLSNNFDSNGKNNATVDRMRTRGLVEIV